MKLRNNGFMLIELVVAITISVIIIGTGFLILNLCLKNWSYAQSSMELNYNSREVTDKLVDEIRESYGVEILDNNQGWIKIYKSMDKTKFITYKVKNNKLFVGYNNTLNSNSEFANYIKSLKLTYLPDGEKNVDAAKGVNIYLEFGDNNKNSNINTSVAFRCRS